jgi:restriction endonuclease BamHI
MKIVETIDVISAGTFPRSTSWEDATAQVRMAIHATDWPHGSGRFTIRPEQHGNGVVPIKKPCIAKLKKCAWETEALPQLQDGVLTTGDLDALKDSRDGLIAFEWETGNISSSHRAINKILLTLHRGAILGGFLIVPSAALYRYLTDRVGNVTELRPYFPLWRAIPVSNGCLQIIVVEHDAISTRVRLIPKGTDGRARR